MSVKNFGVRLCLGLAGVLPAALLLYMGAALLLGLLPEHTDYRPALGGVDVFLRSNGVHADLILPLDAQDVSWRTRLPMDALRPIDGVMDHLAFGWGDRNFYIGTPTWSDLRLSTALVALTGFDTTVLHVEAVRMPHADARTRHISLSLAQYRRLVAFIEGTLRLDAQGDPIIIADAHYDHHDAFFEARGHYSPFATCNEWARRGLAEAGVRVPVWAPFDKALLYQLAPAAN